MSTIVINGAEVEFCLACEGAGFIIVGIESDPQNRGAVEHDGCPSCGGTGTR